MNVPPNGNMNSRLKGVEKSNIADYNNNENVNFVKNPNKYDTTNTNIFRLDNLTGWSLYKAALATNVWYKGRKMTTFTYAGSGSSPEISKALGSPIDLSSYNTFEFVVRFDKSLYPNANLTMIFKTSTGNQYSVNLSSYLINSNKGSTNHLCKIRISKNRFTTTGTPAWNNINSIVINAASDLGDSNTISVAECNGIVKKGILCLDFDDGHGTVYDVALKHMLDNNLKGNAYIVTSFTNSTYYLSEAKLHELHSLGWTIGCHTHTHANLDTTDVALIRYEIDTCQRILKQWGFGSGSLFLAAPFGSWGATARTEALSRLITVRASRSAPAFDNFPPTDNYIIRYISVEDTNSVATLKGIIDTVIANAEMYHMTFHTIGDAGINNITEADFKELIEYIKTKVDAGTLICPTMEELYLDKTTPHYNLFGYDVDV